MKQTCARTVISATDIGIDLLVTHIYILTVESFTPCCEPVRVDSIEVIEFEKVSPKCLGLQETVICANNGLKKICRLNIDSTFSLETH